MNTFRLHLRPYGGAADARTSFEYCLRHGVLGVGWRTETQRSTKVWDEYYAEASGIHDNLNVCSYIHRRVRPGDLVWTRDTDGQYYLARVTSPWEYWVTTEAVEKDIDIANVFRCDIRPVPTDAVPGKVIASFRPSRSIQAIADAKAREYSKHLWNTLTGEATYEVDAGMFADFFMMLDDQETEDLLFLYLQCRGWYVLPHSRKADTMSFEYMLVRPGSGEIAWAQVKTGNTPLNREAYARYPHQVILFQANEQYTGKEAANVTTISRAEVLEFVDGASDWLPAVLKNKMAKIRH